MEDVNEFRGRVRTWLGDRFPLRDTDRDNDRLDVIARAPDGHRALIDRAVALQRDLHAAGFAAVALATDDGGQGLTAEHANVMGEELARVESPSLRPLRIGLGLALPTIMRAGNETQRRRFIPKLISGEEIWCQLFSEPDAGSDLSALRTRAVRDGDSWLVSGQKVWSSLASDAAFGMLLARTDPDADRPQSGLTMFILPMSRRGVSVRPLVDIAGGHHFNEVFLEDVVLHDRDVLGEVDGGWQVATGTLSGERAGYLGGSGGGRRRHQAERAMVIGRAHDDADARLRVVDVAARERLLELLVARIEAGAVVSGNQAAGSLVKVAAGNLEQRAAEVVSDLLGLRGLAWERADRNGNVAAHGLNASRQATIAGGTHQIQRNLIGERLLGLPREPRP